MSALPKDYPKDAQGRAAPFAARWRVPWKFGQLGEPQTGITAIAGGETLGEAIAHIRDAGYDHPEGRFETWDGRRWVLVDPDSA
jgi:hypothetical protein